MSDLLIKDMELPKTCKYCYLSELDPMRCEYVCQPTGTRIDLFLAKHCRIESICPLVLIPSHGRLIDADAVIDLVMQYCPDDDGVCSKAGADLRELLDEIENLPTVIPATEAREAE